MKLILENWQKFVNEELLEEAWLYNIQEALTPEHQQLLDNMKKLKQHLQILNQKIYQKVNKVKKFLSIILIMGLPIDT